MCIKKLSNEFMEKILTDSAWNKLSETFEWTEQMLEKYESKVNWKEISGNHNIVWIPSMLEKFKHLIDWKELSSTGCETILTEQCLEQFADYWDWSALSDNNDLCLNYQLIDKFIDQWDWTKLIDRWHQEHLYNMEFLERYADRIPFDKLQDSYLWRELIEERAKLLKLQVIG